LLPLLDVLRARNGLRVFVTRSLAKSAAKKRSVGALIRVAKSFSAALSSRF
jgi:hypothetical protein